MFYRHDEEGQNEVMGRAKSLHSLDSVFSRKAMNRWIAK
jgi:hypothetical protein